MSKAWSKREVVILRRYYPTYGAMGLTRVLKGRSQGAITGKAQKLGIKADKSEAYFNLKRIAS